MYLLLTYFIPLLLDCNYFVVTFAKLINEWEQKKNLSNVSKSLPANFTFEEMERLLSIFGYEKIE